MQAMSSGRIKQQGAASTAEAGRPRPAVLRFATSESATRAAWRRARSLGYCEHIPRARALTRICFDTPAQTLAHAGIVLRLEKQGKQWVQSVARRRTEHERTRIDSSTPVPEPSVALEHIVDETLRDDIVRETRGQPIEPQYEAQLKRATGTLHVDDDITIEMTVETGRIAANGHAVPWHQVELELIEGEPATLFRAAKALFPTDGLDLSRYSGDCAEPMLAALAAGETPSVPRKAEPVELPASADVDSAARRILRECQQQIARNIVVIHETTDIEGPHQLRIGLRRLRSALSVFKPAFPDAEIRRLRAEAQWLGAEVGRLRDLDAVIADVLRPEAEQFPDESGFPDLIGSLEATAAAGRAQLRETLQTERVQAFGLDLIQLVETRDPTAGSDSDASLPAEMAIRRFANRALRKRWQKVLACGEEIETLTLEQRHALRKELKKIRYMVEFFEPLYPHRRVAPFLKRLKKLQTVFGALNDARVTQRVLDERQPQAADEPAAVERAAGCVIGATRTRAMFDWRKARKHWARLGRAKPFWR